MIHEIAKLVNTLIANVSSEEWRRNRRLVAKSRGLLWLIYGRDADERLLALRHSKPSLRSPVTAG